MKSSNSGRLATSGVMRGGGMLLAVSARAEEMLVPKCTSGRGRGLRWTGRRAAWPDGGVKYFCRVAGTVGEIMCSGGSLI